MPIVPPYETTGQPFEPKKGSGYIFEDVLEINTSGAFLPYNLTGATIRFHLADTSFVTKIDQPATLVSGPAGHVKYAASGSELNLPVGDYLAEWKITFADATTDTVPRGRTYRGVILGTPLGT